MAIQKNVKDFNPVSIINLGNDSVLSIQNGELVRLNGSNSIITGVGEIFVDKFTAKSGFFESIEGKLDSSIVVYVTGDQIISGNKTFTTLPTVNGTGFLLSGGNGEHVFTGNLTVSLANNKTFGRYINGDTIPASGKTTSQVLQLALVEPIAPTISFSSPTTIAFNQTGINNTLNGSHTINSLNASTQTGYIEWRRGGVGSWTKLAGNNSTSLSFNHILTDTNFNTSTFNYRYIVEDTVGALNTGLLNITPASYVAPSLSSISIGSSTVELGDISTTLSATINRNSVNVNLTSYQLQYQSIIGGVTSAWTNIGSSVSISGPSHSFSTAHNDVSLLNATSISYRVLVTDEYTTTTLTMGTRSFVYKNYLGYNSNTTLTLAQIEALTSSTLSDSKTRTILNVTAPLSDYTYYCYRAADGDLNNVVQDDVELVLGSFTKLSDVVGTNNFGASVTYRVYKSNAPGAFGGVKLTFS